MINFRIFRVNEFLIAVHLEYENRPTRIYAFDSWDEAYSFILNNEELVTFWEQYLAKLN